ncbi:MAG TPA: hypothetical protein VH641_14980 [Streptosporangiaceae bacterium]
MTRIEHDGTMQRRVIDTVTQNDPQNWEDLAVRAMACTPPYRPVPGAAIYHICADGLVVQVGEDDLEGPLRDLVTVVLAVGTEPLGHEPAVPAPEGRRAAAGRRRPGRAAASSG